ncbi:MAG TPA: tripartite tricarboxylate transporter substrate binding protein BugD, partial [Xanthobacteraceae bacterium]|nr:tripartite tricarboxylate transporter substrate binding protein BugD [Xanthobacteraceae bacterium]
MSKPLLKLVKLALIAAAVAVPVMADAQTYPSKPITLIVPYAAGGGNDVMARTAADKMSKTLGQQIVIENRGG